MFGLGDVGAVSGACVTGDVHEIVGTDANPSKMRRLDAARTVMEGVRSERIRSKSSAKEAVNHSGIVPLYVGTPSHPNLDAVEAESSQIGAGRQSGRKVRLSRLAPIG